MIEWLEKITLPLTFDPSLGVLNTITNSGQIALIQNKELRFLISSFDGKISDLSRIENTINVFLDSKLRPYLYEVYSSRQTYSSQFGETKFDYDVISILEDKVFENIMIDHWVFNEALRNKQNAVKEHLEKIIEYTTEIDE